MYAVTIRNHSQQYDRPIVKIICDASGLPAQQTVINLSEQRTLHIIRALRANEIEALKKKSAQQNPLSDSTETLMEKTSTGLNS